MLRLALSLLVLATLACSKSAAPPDAGPQPPHALMSPDLDAVGNPFPDDRYVVDGGLQVRSLFYQDYLPTAGITREMGDFQRGNTSSFASISGHGNAGSTLIQFSEPLDPTSLDGGAFFAIETGGTWGPGPAAVSVYEDFGNTQFLDVWPSEPILGATRARLVLTNALHSTSDAPLGRGFDYASQVASDAPSLTSALGIPAAAIVFDTTLVPQAATSDLQAIATWVSQDVPVAYAIALPDGGNDSQGIDAGPLLGTYYADDGGLAIFNQFFATTSEIQLSDDGGAGYPDVGGVVLGTFASHEFRADDVDDGGNVLGKSFNQAWVNDPDAAPTVNLTFVLVLPRGPPPYHVVIGAHGLLGRNSFDYSSTTAPFCSSLGELFTSNGFGCLGIDAIGFGNRGGITDFFNFNELKSTRDSFRQTEADLLQLSRLLTQLDFDPSHPGPDLDAATAGFFGNSLGSIMGTVFMSVDPRIQYGVLNVPTGGLGTIFNSTNLHELVGIFLGGLTGIDYMSPTYGQSLWLFESEAQAVFEDADPFNFARLSQGKHLLAQEGIGDMTLPNANTDELFVAMQLPEITAPLQSEAGVSGFSRVDPATYGITDPSFDPHSVFYAIPAPRHQAVAFIKSLGTQVLPLEPP